MSGPPYPYILPGSNAIGSFVIGVSPIGTIVPFDYWKTIISQYANSDVLTTLIGDFFQYVDQTVNLDAFFDLIWNVSTAQGYGLDVWGRIVDVQRTLQIVVGGYFGFEESGLSGTTFGFAPFYSGSSVTDNFQLADDAFRVLIFAKALSNISNGSVMSINQILATLFPARGNAYVTDDGNMTMTYTFAFSLTSVEQAILTQTGVLPKPVGVSASIVQI